MGRVFNRSDRSAHRRELRNNMTRAEVLLWTRLKSKQVAGLKFRRQQSVGPYVVDFFCPKLRLAIEVDGDSHFGDAEEASDVRRQQLIEGFGVRFLRFTNHDIFEALEHVIATIEQESLARMNRPMAASSSA